MPVAPFACCPLGLAPALPCESSSLTPQHCTILAAQEADFDVGKHQARGDTAIVAHHGLFRCALDATERAYADARLKSAQSVLGKTQVSAPAVEHCRTGERPMGQHASQIKTAS